MVIGCRIRIPDHFSTSLTIAELGILVDVSVFLIQSAADVYDTWWNDWRWQWIHSILGMIQQTFGSESGRTSPEIWILDHFDLKLDASPSKVEFILHDDQAPFEHFMRVPNYHRWLLIFTS